MSMLDDISEAKIGSNSLPELAARIRAEHRATATALQSSVEHAMTAGDLLLEAKALVKHGEWLPWLAAHCEISERTAQLYMRCAKNRKAIEANTQPIADLSLNEAAALLMLSSDLQKLFAFVKQAEDVDFEGLIKLCAEEGIALLHSNPFGAKELSELEESELIEWNLYALIGLKNEEIPLQDCCYYAERLQSRGWNAPEPETSRTRELN